MLKLIFFTFTCYIAVVWTHTPPNFFRKVHHQGRAYQDAVSEHRAYEALYGLNRQNITVNFLDQPIDHANPSIGTFQQQYWIDSTSVDLTTDIAFLYINGEAPGSSMSGYPLLLATEFKALACALEHRFYGKSMPSALTNHTVLPYLTVDNALADLIAFMEYVETSIMEKRLRWVSVGGSYAGALSAWLKVRYNNRLVAAWSSSGVVEAKFDFTFFDGHIAQVLPDRCLQKTKLVLLAWEQLYDDPASRAQLMQMFGTPSYFTKTEMAWALTDGISQMIQYGRKTVWCDAMESSEYAMKLLEAARDVIAKYFTLDVMSECSYSTACMTNEQMSDQWGPSGYAWIYQTCSELAYWQVAYPHSIRPQIITSDFFINQCHAVFGESTFPDVFRFNEKYGGARPFADHVISLQGSDDPWMEVGVRTSLSDTYIVNVAECENCGHCGDLSYPSSNDPSELQKQRELIRQILIQWLHISK